VSPVRESLVRTGAPSGVRVDPVSVPVRPDVCGSDVVRTGVLSDWRVGVFWPDDWSVVRTGCSPVREVVGF
jgi:hypothetical protein